MTNDAPNSTHESESEADENGAAPSEVSTSTTPRVGLHSMLTRDSDMASRPGFRSPSNTRSKAQGSSAKARKPLKVKRKKGKTKR